MQKDKLTMKDIKTDLHKELKNSYFRLVVFSLLFAAISALIYFINPVKFVDVRLFIYLLIFIALAALLLYLVIVQTVDIIKLNKMFRNPACIVKDKLVGMEIKEYYNRYGITTEHHLFFSGYGEYVIPPENYTWSQNFNMSDKSVYNCSTCGDEFYLVLSKPHTGKILLAYNTKMFEFENVVML